MLGPDGHRQPFYTNCTQCHQQSPWHGPDLPTRGSLSLLDKQEDTSTHTREISLTVTGGTYDTAATDLRRYRAAPASLVGLGSRRPRIPTRQPGPRRSGVRRHPGPHQRRAGAPDPAERYSQWDVRFGWWAMWHSGSPAKVGEYQDLNPSPFWDVDGFSSNGTRTLDVTATGTDQETTLGKLYYYQPGVTAKVDYERFLHQLDHDPLNNMAPTSASQASPATTNPKIIKQDLGVGQDYAVRVQELKASFKGIVADDNVKVRLDVWGMEKDGTRQVNARGHVLHARTGHASRPTILPVQHVRRRPGATFSASRSRSTGPPRKSSR